MINIFTARDLIEGNLVKGLLESHGIETRVNGEYLQGGIGELPPTGHITLSVSEEDEKAAREIIRKYENNEYRITDDMTVTGDSAPLSRPVMKDDGPFNQFMTLILGMVIGIAVMIVIYLVPGEKYGHDKNGDGIVDEHHVYKAERLVAFESDRNFDGEFDLWLEYNMDGMPGNYKSDDDFDGKVDSWGEYRDGLLSLINQDSNKDGVVDLRSYLKDELVHKVEFYDLESGRLVKVQHFNSFKLTSQEVDGDGDGRLDKVIHYDEYEEPVNTEYK